ncbi:MAG: hypothetical protein ACYSUI_20540, partial [Planctomycetota bacterium]
MNLRWLSGGSGLVLAGTLGAAEPLLPQSASNGPEEVRTFAAHQLGVIEGIHLDGHLDEQIWYRATPATGFLQEEPDEGAPAT